MKLEFYQTPGTFTSSKISNQYVYDLLSADIYAESWADIQSLVTWPVKYALDYSQVRNLSEVELRQLTSEMRKYLTLVPYEHPLFLTPLDPNLFDSEPYVCVGYDLGMFDKEQAILYTLDSSTYRAGLTAEENTKQVQLRWLHEFEDGTINTVSN
jgi:hypothetical protein